MRSRPRRRKEMGMRESGSWGKLLRGGAVVGLGVAVGLVFCASSVFAGVTPPAPRVPGQPPSPSSKPKGPGVSTAAALRQAGWQSNVKVSFLGAGFRYRSDGVPRQGILDEYAVPNPGVVVPNETNSHVAPRTEVVK